MTKNLDDKSGYEHISIVMQRTAKGYRDGITGLAGVMQKSPIILANKLNPTNKTNALTLEEAAEIIELTNDPSSVDALAAMLNRTTVELPDGEMGLRDLMADYVKLTHESGDLGEEILKAKAPESEWGEQISPAEKKRIAAQIRTVLQIGAGLLMSLES